MKTPICLLVVLVLCFTSFALNELGALDTARAKYTSLFVPGNVIEYTITGSSGYVFNGEAEQCFTGDMAESESELYQEAVLNAKNNLRKYLVEHKKVDAFQLSAVKKLYEYPEGKMRRVVLFVAKDAISACTEPTVAIATNKVLISKGTSNPARKSEMSSMGPTNGVISSSKTVTSDANTKSCVTRTEQSYDDAASRVDKIAIYLKQMKDDPNDCIVLSKVAKIYARQGRLADASILYSRIVKIVLSEEKMDKMFAAGLLMEAARFERNNGNVDHALKYYRLFNRCDGLRRWKLHDMVDEANKNISVLLLSADQDF